MREDWDQPRRGRGWSWLPFEGGQGRRGTIMVEEEADVIKQRERQFL